MLCGQIAGMSDDYSDFQSRVKRISQAHRARVPGAFVHRGDGLLVPRTRRLLRFSFPLKGLIIAFIVSIAVKSYLIWILGADLYQAEVTRLLSGASFEQVAGQILMPDSVSMWVVSRFEWIYQYISQTVPPALG